MARKNMNLFLQIWPLKGQGVDYDGEGDKVGVGY